MTTQSEGMSCSAWRRLVQPAIMNPTAGGEQRQELHEMANGGLSKCQLAARCGDDLQSDDALADGGAPVGTLGEGAVEPRSYAEKEDCSDTTDVRSRGGGQPVARVNEHAHGVIDQSRKQQALRWLRCRRRSCPPKPAAKIRRTPAAPELPSQIRTSGWKGRLWLGSFPATGSARLRKTGRTCHPATQGCRNLGTLAEPQPPSEVNTIAEVSSL